MSDPPCCRNCGFYVANGGIEGTCRRFPPEHPGQYRRVYATDHCGEHKPKSERK